MSKFGTLFSITTFGESHGKGVGCIVEGVPSLIPIDIKDIQFQLNRRKPNQNSLLSPRNEDDIVEIYSGIQNGITLGTPIGLIVKNYDTKPEDYMSFLQTPRPGHADYTYLVKYGIKSLSGGGRASARETISRVCGGAIAEKVLQIKFKTNIIAWVKSVGDISIPNDVNMEFVNSNFSKENIDDLSTFKIFIKNLDSYKNKWNFILFNEKNNICFYCSEINNDFIEISKDNYQNKVKIEEKKEEEKSKNIKNENTNIINNSDKIINNNITTSNITTTIISEKIINSEEKEQETLKTSIIYKENEYIYYETINTRCPHYQTSLKIIRIIMLTQIEKDSIGGIITCAINNCPQGLGEPCFNKFEAELAKAMLSIPATKGFEIGSGFEGTKLKGSQNNDAFINKEKIYTNKLSCSKVNIFPKSNNSGGTLGGITTGETVYFNVAIKPVSTIGRPQKTSDLSGTEVDFEGKGRHDPCVLPRATPIIESMAAMVTLDMSLIQSSRAFFNFLENNENFENSEQEDYF